MSAPLRKAHPIANDPRPALRLVHQPIPTADPMPPRVKAFVRLPSKAPVRREFSFAVGLAVCFFMATIIMLGVTGGTVFWFTHDVHPTAETVKPQPQPQTQMEPVKVAVKAAPLPEVSTAPPAAVLQIAQLIEPKASPDPLPISLDMIVPASTLAPPKSDRAVDKPTDKIATPDGAKTDDLQLTVRDAEPLKDSALAAALAATAKTLARQSRLTEAIAEMESAVRAEPGNVSWRFDLAILYDRVGQGRDALKLYRQVLTAAEEGEVPQNTLYMQADTVEEKPGPLSPEALIALRTRADYLQGLMEGE